MTIVREQGHNYLHESLAEISTNMEFSTLEISGSSPMAFLIVDGLVASNMYPLNFESK